MQRQQKKEYNRGAAILIAVVFFLFASMTVVFGMISPILKQASVSKNIVASKESYYLANGALEDALYRIKNNKNLVSGESLTLNGYTTTITLTSTANGKTIDTSSDRGGMIRKMHVDVSLGTGISFNFGIQSGDGGFLLQNTSSVTGNVFSSGSVTGSGNDIYGDVISAGSNGLIDSVHTTGTAYAHTIQNSTIDQDAYYINKTNTTVGGTSHSNSLDQGTVALPISDAQISQWESDASAGGLATCSSGSYTISSDRTIGPIKIPCNLNINGTGGGVTVTIAGPVWVKGNISITNKATIAMAASLGSQNVAVIADNPSNTTGSGIISVGQNAVFQGSGSPDSWVFMISQNNSSETGGGTDAISMNNGSSALVAYASHGQVTLSQSIGVKEVTAYKIILQNSANVTYDAGLPNTLFSSGPSGGYSISSWQEVQ